MKTKTGEDSGNAELGLSLDSCSVKYYLLEDNAIMQSADEALDDNCKTWWRLDSHPSGRWMIGKEYSNRLFVPIRRPGERPQSTLEKLISQNGG